MRECAPLLEGILIKDGLIGDGRGGEKVGLFEPGQRMWW
jgi:hypothetical protein